ncbi:hypothetical protein [Allorhodopirellula solitaria]|uniref:Uncharacterized protein n=1 Tax=Allorhodopirellula solitaria TaxID=2527987 RepID=A0A5C5X361_9BACT|nr:hypothetical protein [Allorhodopirellula solitaria]TWT56623.1 hypothetical protein CA85_41570 [Allorhodopirellula solitaria]
MKRLTALAMVGCATLGLVALPMAFADTETATIKNSKTVVQTQCKITRDLQNGKTSLLATATVRAIANTPTTLEITTPSGETLMIELKSTILIDDLHRGDAFNADPKSTKH